MLSENNGVKFLKSKNGNCKPNNSQVEIKNNESELSNKYPLDPRGPFEAVWYSCFSSSWTCRKTSFRYSELFSDQYISRFLRTTLLTKDDLFRVTIYVHYHECHKDKVLKISNACCVSSLGEVLDIVSKYPVLSYIIKTNTGTIIDEKMLNEPLMHIKEEYGISGQTFHIYVQIPGTDKPQPPYQWLGKRYNNFNFFIF